MRRRASGERPASCSAPAALSAAARARGALLRGRRRASVLPTHTLNPHPCSVSRIEPPCLPAHPPPAPAPRSKLPCFDFMVCEPAEGPIFTELSQLERLETL